jgi:hypothetical protein
MAGLCFMTKRKKKVNDEPLGVGPAIVEITDYGCVKCGRI